MHLLGCRYSSTNHRGFTLVELLVVVTLIGVMVGMASLAISSGDNRELDSRQTAAPSLEFVIDEATYKAN